MGRSLSGRALVAGVIGWPVGHSRSPALHGHWLARYGIDGAYVPLAVAPGDLAVAVRGLVAAGFRGVNVTLPHKAAVLGLCDRVEASAMRAGAVNTLVFGPGGIVGSNTDIGGFVASLVARGVDPGAGPALVLGAGGAARAVAAGLLDAGARVTVANRSMERAAALAAALPGVRVVAWEERAAALRGCALLVNATQLGMVGQAGLEMPLDGASAGLVVADVVYAPLETRLLAAAAARGLRTVPGIGMLLHQAVPGFAAWFGVTPVVDGALEAAVLAAGAPGAGAMGAGERRAVG